MQQCILSLNNREEVLELPVPLQEWSLDAPHSTYRFQTMGTGEVLAIGTEQLEGLVVESFFPASRDYSFLYNRDFPDPWECVQMIKRWKGEKGPIRVIIVGTDVNHAMAIENFTVSKADATKDVYFSLELIEYSFLTTKRSQRPGGDDGDLKDRQEEKEGKQITEHTVKGGDTLWDLAERHLGGGHNWKQIAELNGIANPKTLQIGQKLKIPQAEGEVLGS